MHDGAGFPASGSGTMFAMTPVEVAIDTLADRGIIAQPTLFCSSRREWRTPLYLRGRAAQTVASQRKAQLETETRGTFACILDHNANFANVPGVHRSNSHFGNQIGNLAFDNIRIPF